MALMAMMAMMAMMGVYRLANLGVGFTFSTLARNQLQALQMPFFFSAFAAAVGLHVPIPRHAAMGAVLGEVLPLTHFLRIVRGILLKGNSLAQRWPELWPMALFLAAAGALSLAAAAALSLIRYRQTVDQG